MASRPAPTPQPVPDAPKPGAERSELLALIGERMKRARVEILGLSQEELGLSLTGAARGRGIQDNERGVTMPSGSTLARLVSQGVSANWILTGVGEMRVSEEVGSWKQVTHPLTHAPLLAVSPTILAQMGKGLDGTQALLGWYVQDSSMAPLLNPGDLAILTEGATDLRTGVALLQLRDASCLLRRLAIAGDGTWTLSASNRAYGTVQYTQREMEHASPPLRVLGWMVARYGVPTGLSND